jgi:hypothetical protein
LVCADAGAAAAPISAAPRAMGQRHWNRLRKATSFPGGREKRCGSKVFGLEYVESVMVYAVVGA